ncbi:hypothetical protein RJ45_09400 [Photobacterium gaetbulicola]|uniref:Uncharacterized protein n=1 Tax=Photobacterium gaetbulicola TaxID=1295392 RepID=A0A0B9GYU3_9GAMM|nr:hypothetical protein RJ45_09400 [Photobacterium gaetbulicola]
MFWVLLVLYIMVSIGYVISNLGRKNGKKLHWWECILDLILGTPALVIAFLYGHLCEVELKTLKKFFIILFVMFVFLLTLYKSTIV